MDKKYQFKEDPERNIIGNFAVRLYDENNNELGYYEYDTPIGRDKWVMLQQLFVRRQYRGLGLSDVLIKHFLKFARNIFRATLIDVYIVPLEEGIELERLINLYVRHGFEIIDRSSEEAQGRIKIAN